MIDGKDYTSDEIIKDVDIEIKELVKLINKIDGVETVISCFGHHKTPCQIWLRIKDIDTAKKFYRKFIYTNPLWDLILTYTELERRKDELLFVLQSRYKDYPTVNLMVDTLTHTFKDIQKANCDVCKNNNDDDKCYLCCKGIEDNFEEINETINKSELLDYVTKSIEAEKKMIGSCHDLASEDYHKGIIYAFECMKMKLM